MGTRSAGKQKFMSKEAACYERGWEHRPDTPQAQAAVKQLIEKYN